MKPLYFLVLALVTVALSACGNSPEDRASNKATGTDDNGGVLATVDSEVIYESDLEAVLISMFGDYRAQQMDAASKRRALDSLIATSLLARQALSTLPKKSLDEIEAKTRRYRENQLVNAYMLTRVDKTPINNKEIKAFYESNLDNFGQSIVKQYQLLTTRGELPEELREKFMSLVSDSKSIQSLTEIKNILEKNGFDVQLAEDQLDAKITGSRLYNFVNAQPVNTVSDQIFIEGRPYIVKVLHEKTIAAKPLAQVSDTIRKSIMLQRLKTALKQHSEELLSKSNVEYRD